MSDERQLNVGGMPSGFDAMALGEVCRLGNKRLVYIARDAKRLDEMKRALAFFAPDIPTLHIPAWDCLPYDRLSPQAGIMAQRMASLAALQVHEDQAHIVLTTISAATQKMPNRDHVSSYSFLAKPGQSVDLDKLTTFLISSGFSRCSTVTEPGDFAFRGSIVDIFPPGEALPFRMDFFGDHLETIRSFDVETQRSIGPIYSLNLVPAGEIHLDEATVKRFRQAYVRCFGGTSISDPIYEAISSGARHLGMEHWLPFFHETVETLFDHAGDGAVYYLEAQVEQAREERHLQIEDYFSARQNVLETADAGSALRPLPVEDLYLDQAQWQTLIEHHKVRNLSPFTIPDSKNNVNMPGRAGYQFSSERAQEGVNVFDAVVAHIQKFQNQSARVYVDCGSDGARQRMAALLNDHGITRNKMVENGNGLLAELQGSEVGFTCFGLEQGFEAGDVIFIGEQDILGDRLIRSSKKKRADNFLTEATSLSQGDYVVHIDHGIGRFEGLETVDVAGAPHACLRLIYHDNARLFLPVENIELLSRYGGDDTSATLDRLGGQAWQSRKARLKEKLNLIADSLIRIAAERSLREGQKFEPIHGLYEEFCARFPFDETDDQLNTIEAVLDDLASGKPMDRLVCGDVGFGKTEVALRAAQIVAMNGGQVAIVAPTTILARQHFKTFSERFSNLPVNVSQLSRLVSNQQASQTREGLADGTVDIVIGTHALLAKSIDFKRLGLVIVDEEQHFGVAHKERLKEIRSGVHVLTLTATPIPRTLQMALTGVRDLSIIATPPVDRLAIRTYITPFDAVIIREALLREKYRGGQSFFIVPRISNVGEIEEFLRDQVPEVKFTVAHGQMPGSYIEARMTSFYEGQQDVLVSTSIIESGLDIPAANTMIIHRSDMFGLAQLYQMRGRVGRSKLRAFAYLTYQTTKPLTPAAEKRLQILQSLDNLGAGFTLASHDLDLRGAGNLVGEEQTGHIREVGYELYQSMLEEAVASRQGDSVTETWSPQINLGLSVMIGEDYVPDLELRMGLYRRLSLLDEASEIEGFAAELIDRFGAMPEATENLLNIIKLKLDCYSAGIEKIDAGPKGAAIHFKDKKFANPAGLVQFISEYGKRIKLRPDHSLVIQDDWIHDDERLKGVQGVVAHLRKVSEL